MEAALSTLVVGRLHGASAIARQAPGVLGVDLAPLRGAAFCPPSRRACMRRHRPRSLQGVQVLNAALRGMAPSDAAAAARGILGAPPQVAESMLECACLAIREQLVQPFPPQQSPVPADDPRWEPLGKMLLSLTELVPKAVDITLPELRRNAPLSPLVPPLDALCRALLDAMAAEHARASSGGAPPNFKAINVTWRLLMRVAAALPKLTDAWESPPSSSSSSSASPPEARRLSAISAGAAAATAAASPPTLPPPSSTGSSLRSRRPSTSLTSTATPTRHRWTSGHPTRRATRRSSARSSRCSSRASARATPRGSRCPHRRRRRRRCRSRRNGPPRTR